MGLSSTSETAQKMNLRWHHAMWVGVPREELARCHILEGDLTGRFAYYKCLVELNRKATLSVLITANSRYRLWVNGQPVHSGPCKGDLERIFYDEIDISRYLQKGTNILAVQVLYSNADSVVKQGEERTSILGVFTPAGGHRLAMEGMAYDENGETLAEVTTGIAPWQVHLEGSYHLKCDDVTVNMGGIVEEIDYHKALSHWKMSTAMDGFVPVTPMETAVVGNFEKTVGFVQRFQLHQREIPLLLEVKEEFQGECTGTGILEEDKIVVKANTIKEIILDAATIKNGYPFYRFDKGNEAEIEFTYFEKFVNENEKIRKDDWKNGQVTGLTDTITLNGKALTYEPFWYRTFRFLRIRVQTKEEEAVIYRPTFRTTGYPLTIESQVTSSAPWVQDVYEMCVRTLQNCMIETYMDCPYYEQMQFPMDTRLQAMFTYCISNDVRLAKKALEDYHYAMLPEGLIPGKYPSAYRQIISTFSLYYVYMLWEYYEQTGDQTLLREYRPDVDRILDYYDRKIGTDGLVQRLGYWEFVDWQQAWADTSGMPTALQTGPSTIINLMYAFALNCGANIYRATGRPGVAEEYEKRRENICQKVHALCWDEKRGMYREGPTLQQFSQHAQSWSVLNDLCGSCEQQADRGDGTAMRTGKQAGFAEIMTNAMAEDVIPCSFSTAFEFFRAMEKAGLYEKTRENIMRWVHLLDWGSTTCPEEPENGRSECHGWSALPMYEMLRVMAGIVYRRTAGECEVAIRPHLEYVPDLTGKVCTPEGIITFSYRKDTTGKWQYEVHLPKNLKGTFIYPDGAYRALSSGSNSL